MGGSAERREEKREFFLLGSSPEGGDEGISPHIVRSPVGLFLGQFLGELNVPELRTSRCSVDPSNLIKVMLAKGEKNEQ